MTGEHVREDQGSPAQTNPPRPSRLGLALVLLLALVLRAAWVVDYGAAHPQASMPVIDEASYDGWARELAAGDWLGDEVFFQEPLYPYTLGAAYALFGADMAVARWWNVALGLLFVWWTTLVAARLVGGRLALAVGAAAACAIPLVHTTALVLKPSLFLALMSGLVLALLRARERPSAGRLLAVGALVGLAALVRGNALLLAPVVVARPFAQWCLGWRRSAAERVGAERAEKTSLRASLGQSAWAGIGVALVLLPVAARNQYVGGVFAPTTSGAGTNLYVGNSLDNPWGVATELDFVRGIPEHEAEDWRREAERRLGRALDPGEVSTYWLAAALRSFAAAPVAHLGNFWRKLRLALHRGEVADNHALAWDSHEVRAGRGRASVLDLPLGGWAPWGALGLAGALLLAAPRRFWGAAGRRDCATEWGSAVDVAAAREVALWLGLYLGTLVLTVVVGRMRLPLFVFALPLAPIAPLALLHALRAGDRRAAWAPAGALLIAFAFAFAPARPRGLEASDLLERDFNLAVQLVERGDPVAALGRIEPLLAQTGSARALLLAAEARLLLARELTAQGNEADGRVELQRAQALADAAVSGDPVTPGDALAPGERAPVGNAALRGPQGRATIGPRERHHADALAGRIALASGDAAAALPRLAAARAFDATDAGLALDELRARALSMLGSPSLEALEPLRAEAATLAQDPELAPALATPARILWAELEAAVGARASGELAQRRTKTALQVLQGTLAGLDEGDPARAAVQLAAARVQLGIGNEAAARRLLEGVLADHPAHETARRLLGALE
ncbi:MAG: glycosyltransferase family 39 protein [Planctomycetota bacterium]